MSTWCWYRVARSQPWLLIPVLAGISSPSQQRRGQQSENRTQQPAGWKVDEQDDLFGSRRTLRWLETCLELHCKYLLLPELKSAILFCNLFPVKSLEFRLFQVLDWRLWPNLNWSPTQHICSFQITLLEALCPPAASHGLILAPRDDPSFQTSSCA